MATVQQPIIIDGRPLKEQLARAERRKKYVAFAMVLPLLLFILITFAIPIGSMLFRSVDNPRMITLAPQLTAELSEWDGQDMPPEEVFEAAVKDFKLAAEAGTLGRIATRVNYSMAGARSLIVKSKRKFKNVTEGPYREVMIKADKRWGELDTWKTLKKVSVPYTPVYFLNAIDRDLDGDGNIVKQPSEKRIYVKLFVRTLWIALLVTVLTLILGYPIAYLISTQPPRISNLLIIMVLLPFWTSLLVRTTSWIVLLQTQGVLNDLMVWMGVISDDGRIQMIYNLQGTLIAMTQILLPFMVLPMYSVMKTIPLSELRASQSLGANPFITFFRIFLPRSIPGIGAGGLLVFVVSVGYYITPALVGGAKGQMISNQIAFHMKSSLNWGLAAALGTILLVGVLVLYWLYDKVVGIDKMKLG
ncbi:MAG: ABC transporter permease [Acidiferrobacteraceae bacterium]|nr:ABC transporter permease [Acidiferrobacteraceae bacterium]|tara:strand:+ start:967 stop:2217 length:1251 start_codon:yes stop_codon:yes gene_type:complete